MKMAMPGMRTRARSLASHFGNRIPVVDSVKKKVDKFCSSPSRLYGQIPDFMGRTDFMGKPA
jgi:hypothetical protein